MASDCLNCGASLRQHKTAILKDIVEQIFTIRKNVMKHYGEIQS